MFLIEIFSLTYHFVEHADVLNVMYFKSEVVACLA